MKIILTHEVEKLGQPGDVVEVKDGYGRNYLIPRGYATQWTRGAQRQIDQINEARRRRSTEDIESARESRDALEGKTIEITKTAGSNGRLFGAVTTKDVADVASKLAGKTIDRRQVHLNSSIKSVGEYSGSVKLGEDINANVTIEVVAAE